jgi:hypothetical protein
VHDGKAKPLCSADDEDGSVVGPETERPAMEGSIDAVVILVDFHWEMEDVVGHQSRFTQMRGKSRWKIRYMRSDTDVLNIFTYCLEAKPPSANVLL